MELTGHANEDIFIAYFCGELGEERTRHVKEHIENCEPCRKEYAIYKSLFSGMLNVLKQQSPAPTARELRSLLQRSVRPNQVFYTVFAVENFGLLLLARTERGLASVIFGKSSKFELEEKLKENFASLWILEAPQELQEEKRQFEEYFSGARRNFELTIDQMLMKSPYQKSVLESLSEIPFGHFITYGELARRTGKPAAARAVGRILGKNPLPIILPCHRVVASKGKLGGFTGGIDLKLKLLQIEGVIFPHTTRQKSLFTT